MHLPLRALAASLLAVTLASCQSVPPASLPALATVDPLALDPAALRAAVVHSRDVRLPEGTTTLRLVLSDRNGAVLRDEAFVLRTRPADPADGVPTPPPGGAAAVLSLAAEDRPRFAALQAIMRERRRTAPGTSSLAVVVSARPCREGRAGEARLATYLAMRPGGRFVPVSRTGPHAQDDGGRLRPCTGEGA